MIFLIIFFGTIIGVMLIALFIFLYAKHALNKTIGKENLDLLTDQIKKGFKDGEFFDDDIETEKCISGMTDLLEDRIKRDFDDFHASELFSLNNANLKSIFNALEEKTIAHIDENPTFDLIKANIYEEIQDMIGRDINVSYDNIKIHRNTIKSYTNQDGSATIEVNTSLSYMYIVNEKGRRKQTRYTTKYVFVYDSDLFDGKSVTYAVNCPNCGAPVPTKGDTTCKFCGSHVGGVDFNTINLKGWKLVSYIEY